MPQSVRLGHPRVQGLCSCVPLFPATGSAHRPRTATIGCLACMNGNSSASPEEGRATGRPASDRPTDGRRPPICCDGVGERAHHFLREYFLAVASHENREIAAQKLADLSVRLEHLMAKVDRHTQSLGIEAWDHLEPDTQVEIDALRPIDWLAAETL